MISSKVDVLVAFGPEIALKAAVAASQSVPIVMIAVNFDPVAGGYVSNIARPEKNITGVVYRAPELAAKQLELLVEASMAFEVLAPRHTGFSKLVQESRALEILRRNSE